MSTSAAAGALFAISGSQNRVLGANDRIRMAVSGLRGRGGSLISNFSNIEGVEVVCLIDPDSRQLDRRADEMEGRELPRPTLTQDVRKALEDESIDALGIATPNHWHSLQTIWGCQAGKDVFVEKPLSHNVHEGRVAVEAARRYNRIVAHGTQGRSGNLGARAAYYAQEGTFGKMRTSYGLCYKRRDSIGHQFFTPPPAQVDFDLWLGPAPEQPHHGNLVHYDWHWFWDFGNGDIGNQGVHQIDVARWAIPGATLPKSVISIGGRWGYEDQAQTPNTQIALFDYGDTQLIFEVRGLETDRYYGQGVGNLFRYDNGVVAGNRFYADGEFDAEGGEGLPSASASRGPGRNHWENFIEAMRSRNVSDLDADVLEGHYSSALCHLANVSYQLGREFPMSDAPKAFDGCDDAVDAVERMFDHLKANGLDLIDLDVCIGRKLIIDAESETVVGDPHANALLTRTYRAPYTVPEQIA